jgi:hypothetical protein
MFGITDITREDAHLIGLSPPADNARLELTFPVEAERLKAGRSMKRTPQNEPRAVHTLGVL